MICGTISAAENPTIQLANVPVELRDWHGTLLSTTKSDSSGGYSFGPTGLSTNNTYYVTPVVGRTESAVPLYNPVANLQSVGALVNPQIRGVPGTLQISGAPAGSYILISTASYTGSNAPTMNSRFSGSIGYYSAATGWDGAASVHAPTGTSYYLTCWVAQPAGPSVTYARMPASGSSGPYTVSPNTTVPLSCPTN